MYLDKSVEYWIGWTLAYYQWYSSKSFCEIETVISVEELGKKYYPLHEADISKTVEIIDERFVERERQV